MNRAAVGLASLLLALSLAAPLVVSAAAAARSAPRPLRMTPAPSTPQALAFRNPLSYVARLNSPAPPLGVAPGFLADQGAQRWLQRHRPAAYPGLLKRALELEDMRDVLTAPQGPRVVRDALLARPEDPQAMVPDALLRLVDANAALLPDRALYENAVLEWGWIGAEVRSELEGMGLGEDVWAQMTLADRAAGFRQALSQLSVRLVTAHPGTPEYATQLEAALGRFAPAMTEGEVAMTEERIESAKRLAEGLARAERLVEARGSRSLGRLLDATREMELDEAVVGLGEVFDALGASEERAALEGPIRRPTLDAAERDELQSRLVRELERQLRGDPYGRRVLAGIRRGGVAIRVGEVRYTAAAHYNHVGKEIVVGDRFLAIVLREMGVEQRRLLSDDGALRDIAALLCASVVHEGTHHLQVEWWADKREAFREDAHFSQHAEREAFLAEAGYLARRRESDPSFTPLLARVPDVIAQAISVDVEIRKPNDSFHVFLHRAYRHTPTLARAAARLILPDGHLQPARREQVRRIEEALAERRRMSRAEKERLQREAEQGVEDAIGTGTLREWVDEGEPLYAGNVRLALELWSRYLRAVDRLSAAIGL